jgi:outer membrane lipoprotein-sorting protein
LTPAELLTKVRTAKVTALSGSVQLTSNLGLPSLGSLGASGGGGSSTSLTSLLAGSHSAQVWIDGTEHVRVATVAPMAETNWIRNGQDLWSYDSSTLTTTHASLGVASAGAMPSATTDSSLDPVHDTPIQFAQELLDKVTPSTGVAITDNTMVAGRAVYQLVLTPNDVTSTVQDVTFAVDAATGLPLDVSVTAKSSGTTALEIGFTSIDFSVPSASTFEFTPPPGSTVVEAKDPASLLSAGGDVHGNRHRTDATGSGLGQMTTLGQNWTTVAVLSTSSVASQLQSFLTSAPQVTVGGASARLVTTTLFNVLVFDDGRIAVGAVDPTTLESLVIEDEHVEEGGRHQPGGCSADGDLRSAGQERLQLRGH